MLKSPKNGRYTPQNWRNPGTTRMSNTQTANPPPPTAQKSVSNTVGWGGVVLLRILDWGGGCAARFSKSWPYFTPKDVIFHTRFQTWPLKSIPVFKPGGGHKTQHTCLRRQKLDNHYWDWERQQKKYFLKSNNNNNNTLFHPIIYKK